MNRRLQIVFLVILAGLVAGMGLCVALLATGQVKGSAEDAAERGAAACFVAILLTFGIRSFVAEQFRLEFRRYLLRVLASTTGRGLSLGHAFLALAEDFDGPRRSTVYRVLGLLDQGRPLSEALAGGARDIVPPHVVEAIRAAERGGNLAVTLVAAAEESVAARSQRALVGRAALYPVAILAVGLFLATYIVPQFGVIFSQIAGPDGRPLELPAATQWFLGLCDLALRHVIPLALALGLVLLPFAFGRVRRRFDWLLDPLSFRVPILGRFRRLQAGERVCGALAGLVRAGVPLETALPQAAASSGSASVRRAAEEAVAGIRAGTPPDRALQHLLLPGFVRARAAAATGGTPERLAAALEGLSRECQWRHLGMSEAAAGAIYPATLLFGSAFVFLTWLSVFGAISGLQGALIPW